SNDRLYRLNADTGEQLGLPIVLPSRTYGGVAVLGGVVYVLDSLNEDLLRVNPDTGAVTVLDLNALNPGLSLNDALGEFQASGELISATSTGVVFINPATGLVTR